MLSPSHKRPSDATKDSCAVTAEIISTERFYIHEMRTFLEVLLRPLQRQIRKGDLIITEQELATLECNMEEVFSLSRMLLRELERASSTLGSSSNKKTVGEVFARYAEPMRIAYVKFVSMYLSAFALSTRLMKERQKRKNASCTFAAFMKECGDRQRQRVRTRRFEDFLILPVQRVPRYRLLLIELWKKTPASLERDWIKEAVLRISAVATEMNRNLSQATSERKLLKQKSSHQKMVEQKDHDDNAFLHDDEDDEDDEMFERVQGLQEALYRPRPPTLFNLDAPGDDEPDSMLVTKEEELERMSLSKGWISPKSIAARGQMFVHAPTSNPFVLLNLLTRDPVFEDDLSALLEKQYKQKLKAEAAAAKLAAASTQPQQRLLYDYHHNHVSQPKRLVTPTMLYMKFMTRLYSPLQPVKPFRPKPNDLVVVGPVRCGQTPVLHILECLRRGNVVPVTSLLDRVMWLESDDWDKPTPLSEIPRPAPLKLDEEPVGTSSNDDEVIAPRERNKKKLGRLIKTNAGSLKEAFGGLLLPCSKRDRPEFRVVAVVRDPADLRLSVFRHLRRIYRKTLSWSSVNEVEIDDDEGTPDAIEVFDLLFNADSFVSCALSSYESFLADAVNVVLELSSPQLMIVSYEEIIDNPSKVVSKLAKFTELLDDFSVEEQDRIVTQIAHEIQSQREFPCSSGPERQDEGAKCAVQGVKRIGSSGQGRTHLSRSSLDKLDGMWKEAGLKEQFPSYSVLMATMKTPRSLTFQEALMKANTSKMEGMSKTLVLSRAVAKLARSASFTMLSSSSAGARDALAGKSSTGKEGPTVFYTGGTANALVDRSNLTDQDVLGKGKLTRKRPSSFSLLGNGLRGTHLGVNTPLSGQQQQQLKDGQDLRNSLSSQQRHTHGEARASNLTQTTIGSSSVTSGTNSKDATDQQRPRRASFISLLKPLVLIEQRRRKMQEEEEALRRGRSLEVMQQMDKFKVQVDPDDTDTEDGTVTDEEREKEHERVLAKLRAHHLKRHQEKHKTFNNIVGERM